MTFIADAINKLQGLIEKGQEFKIQRLPGDKAGRFFTQDAEGKPQFFETEPGDKIIRDASLTDIVRNATTPLDDRYKEKDSLIVYTMNTAELIYDHVKCDSSIGWIGEMSREYEIFRDWMTNARNGVGVRLSVHEAVQLFDTTLRGAMPSVDWLESINKLEIQHNEQMQAQQDATSSLAGGLVNKQVTSSLPTGEVTFNVRVLADTTFNRIPLKCYIRADLDNRCWSITPIADSWAELIEAQFKAVRDRLEAAEEYVSDIVRGSVRWEYNGVN